MRKLPLTDDLLLIPVDAPEDAAAESGPLEERREELAELSQDQLEDLGVARPNFLEDFREECREEHNEDTESWDRGLSSDCALPRTASALQIG